MKYVSLVSHQGFLYALREDGKLFLIETKNPFDLKIEEVTELPVCVIDGREIPA